MAWFNLIMSNQTVKNGLKAKNIKLHQMNLFLEKQLKKFWCTYLPLSFLQNFKKNVRPDPELWGCAIIGPKMAHFCMNKLFLVQTIIITLIYLLGLFIVQNFKKFLQHIQSYEDAPFLGQKWSICPEKIFLKIINIILIYLLVPFIVQNFKKILPADPDLWGCAIFGPKMAHFPKWEFCQKTC